MLFPYSLWKIFFIGQNLKRVHVTYSFDGKITSVDE